MISNLTDTKIKNKFYYNNKKTLIPIFIKEPQSFSDKLKTYKIKGKVISNHIFKMVLNVTDTKFNNNFLLNNETKKLLFQHLLKNNFHITC